MFIRSQPLLFLISLLAAVGAFSPSRTRSHLTPLRSATLEPAETTAGSTTEQLPATDSYPSARQPVEEGAPSPGLAENDKFDCDDNVKLWRDFQRGGFASAEDNARALAAVASNFASLGPEGISYWLRHVGRSAYFATNAVLGNVGYQLHERLVNGRETTFTGVLPFDMSSSIASRLVLEAALSYEQDYEQIRRGSYREPWDMKLNHRQSSPINVVTQTGRFISEAIGTLGRRSRSEQKDKDIWIFSDEASATTGMYPDYYRTAFHYQTDGWMSKRSADVYETSTETLFLGRQDAMQRTSLKALVDLSKKLKKEGGGGSLDRPMRVLEVAAGTGRFMTFIRDNLPLDAEYTAVDLSPFYLDVARDNDNYWRKTRKAQEKQSENGETEILPARLVQAQAESLPFDSDSFDAVVCVYLFHELPRNVRERVAAEMARVVSPGGTVVLTDSIQRGDRPILDSGLDNFENMNEPYYGDYCRDDLSAHFEDVGLQPMTKTLRSTTKSLSFTKP